MTRTPHPAPDAGTIVLLIVLAAIWGGSFFFAEIALRELPPLTLTLFRVTLAVPVLACGSVSSSARGSASVARR